MVFNILHKLQKNFIFIILYSFLTMIKGHHNPLKRSIFCLCFSYLCLILQSNILAYKIPSFFAFLFVAKYISSFCNYSIETWNTVFFLLDSINLSTYLVITTWVLIFLMRNWRLNPGSLGYISRSYLIFILR